MGRERLTHLADGQDQFRAKPLRRRVGEVLVEQIEGTKPGRKSFVPPKAMHVAVVADKPSHAVPAAARARATGVVVINMQWVLHNPFVSGNRSEDRPRAQPFPLASQPLIQSPGRTVRLTYHPINGEVEQA